MSNNDFPDRVATEREAAIFTSLSRLTLQRYRRSGTGPTFIRLGARRIGYRLSDLRAWMDERAGKRTGKIAAVDKIAA
jgi:predicted DNA-binding transcriptional regulator AlpA